MGQEVLPLLLQNNLEKQLSDVCLGSLFEDAGNHLRECMQQEQEQLAAKLHPVRKQRQLGVHFLLPQCRASAGGMVLPTVRVGLSTLVSPEKCPHRHTQRFVLWGDHSKLCSITGSI